LIFHYVIRLRTSVANLYRAINTNDMSKVKSLLERSLTLGYESVHINYIVFEKNDDGLLLECEIEKNNNRFHTTICIDFYELNRLMGILSSVHDLDIYGLISEHIVSNTNSVCEVDLIKELGHPLTLKNYAFNTIKTLKSA
jgi:hypothetical protein